MNAARRFAGMALGLGLLALTTTGCQTQTAGMTLPTGRYLEHPPQYFPSDPVFPLPRELAQQEKAAAAGLPGGPPAGGLPAPLPAR